MKNKNRDKFQYLIGIDEVGRGPLAGPVAVGACLIPVLKIKDFVGQFIYWIVRRVRFRCV